jgi:hypothetical protein
VAHTQALKLLLSLPVSPEQANAVRSPKGTLSDAVHRMAAHHRDPQVRLTRNASMSCRHC